MKTVSFLLLCFAALMVNGRKLANPPSHRQQLKSLNNNHQVERNEDSENSSEERETHNRQISKGEKVSKNVWVMKIPLLLEANKLKYGISQDNIFAKS